MAFDIKSHPSIFMQPKITVNLSMWREHAPVAFLMIEMLKPRTFVELGVFNGSSFNIFCEAVQLFNLETKCYGVDTWEGDPHKGPYDISVYNKLYKYLQNNYKDSASLLKMTFDEALGSFKDKSIDLLHIDGYHTYEAVKHDYETWLPKMSDSGVIIFHDTNIKEHDFGVWKFWEEVSPKHPSYEFKNSCGLGILAVGKRVDNEFILFLDTVNKDDFIFQLLSRLGRLAYVSDALFVCRQRIKIMEETKGDPPKENGKKT